MTAGEAGEKLIPLFAEKAGFDSKKLKVVNMGPSAKYASLVAKSVNSIIGFINEAPPIEAAAKKTGLQVGRFVFSDYGIDYYSLGLITSDKMIADRPDVVRRFVLATMKGYAWAIKHPQKAADDFAKNYPETSRAIVIQQWNAALPLIDTKQTRKNGLGMIDPVKMAATLKLISQNSANQGFDHRERCLRDGFHPSRSRPIGLDASFNVSCRYARRYLGRAPACDGNNSIGLVR